MKIINSNVEKFFKRHICKKSTIVFLIILMILSIIFLAFSSYNINSLSMAVLSTEAQNIESLNNKYKLWCTFKDIAVVFFSSIGLNLLFSVFYRKEKPK